MTCIVALKHEGRVYLGADSCYTTDSLERSRVRQPKLFKPYEDGSVVIGITGATGLHTVVKRQVDWQSIAILSRDDAARWVEKHALTELRRAYQAACTEVSGTEHTGSLLIATMGRVWEVSVRGNAADEIEDDAYTAIGSGALEAMGALFVLRNWASPPQAQVEAALQAAAHHRVDCAAPFIFADV